MIFGLVLLLLILVLLAVLLWLPFRLIIDSKRDIYTVEWRPFGSALLVETENGLGIKMRILFFKKTIPIEQFFRKKRVSKNIPPPKAEKPKRKRGKFSFIKLIKTFDIKLFKVNWDTDDFILNAYLYPFTPLFRNPNKTFSINFEGKRDVILVVENRLIRIIKLFFNQ